MEFLCIVKKCLFVMHVYLCVYFYTEGEDAAISKICIEKDLLWDE